MNNTSSDNFERIAEDTMDLLIATLGALTSEDAGERQAVELLVRLAASSICKRAIALTA